MAQKRLPTAKPKSQSLQTLSPITRRVKTNLQTSLIMSLAALNRTLRAIPNADAKLSHSVTLDPYKPHLRGCLFYAAHSKRTNAAMALVFHPPAIHRSAEDLQAEVIRPGDMNAQELAAWADMRKSEPEFKSPLL